MYDNICKFLAESFPTDIATWLIGEPIPLTEINSSELSLEPIRPDSLILKQSDDLVLHAEFQTEPDPTMPFRMADYRLRVYRRHPQKRMYQVVIYLRQTSSQYVYQDTFIVDRLRHQFNVIRLWEQPPEVFLDTPGLLPFAVLTRQSSEALPVLQQVARNIDIIPERRAQANIAASAAILAGLVLETDVIQRVLRREIMRESVIYQEIRQEGLDEGKEQEKQKVARKLLQEGMSIEKVASITELSVEEVLRLQG
jgi:predicted transposase/invertase (TIGR01784 family)